MLVFGFLAVKVGWQPEGLHCIAMHCTALHCTALHRSQMQQVLHCCILVDCGDRQPVVEQRQERAVTQRRLYQFMVEFGLFSLAVDFCLVLVCANTLCVRVCLCVPVCVRVCEFRCAC